MARVVDTSGCCPRVQMLCRPDTCPEPSTCPPHHEAKATNGAPPAPPAARCSVTECPPIATSDQFVVEARPVPFACCPVGVQVACRAGDTVYRVGENWTSPHDVCESYQCIEVGGGQLERLQVQTSNETCPSVSVALRKQFVLKEEKPEGKCCNTSEPVACREGQTWPSSDPCTNYSCARDGTGRLAHAPRVQSCVTECKRGWVLEPPPQGVCCGHCRQAQCVVDNEYIDTGSTWQSADNCTTYTCERDGDSVLTTSARVACPDVSACAPEDLVNETCCQVLACLWRSRRPTPWVWCARRCAGAAPASTWSPSAASRSAAALAAPAPFTTTRRAATTLSASAAKRPSTRR
ncbi:hypothetical protein MSG28_003153 [Choristoneura fumiferana]|uniref:Uncharacterized protein n=1 Tax=Choristoneura fumiferana TaxID=7141 RepID=A0ACC0KE82_CHOFU|nr:hypothetical protein MSG28_003153 [Choristoneura fumiferana]